MNKIKKLLSNLGPNVKNKDILRILKKGGDLHHFYDHIVDGGEVQYAMAPDIKFKAITFGSHGSVYIIKPKTRKAFMVGDVELESPLTLRSVNNYYYLVNIEEGTYSYETWDGHQMDKAYIEAGAGFETQAGAQAFLDAVGWREVDIDE